MPGQGLSHRDDAVAGVLVAATIVVLGWATGFGHLTRGLVSSSGTVPAVTGATGAPEAASGAGTTSLFSGSVTDPAVGAGAAAAPAAGQQTTSGSSGVTGAAASTATRPISSTKTTTVKQTTTVTTTGPTSPSRAATAAPSASAVPTTDTSQTADQSSCTDLADAIVQPFVVHVEHGHLEESPGQQVQDILNLDQYVKTHTVLVEDMTSWDTEIAPALTASVSAFVTHVQHGHLEESPGQQVQDILNVDQYVKTHTVLVENMATPITDVVDGTGSNC